MNLEPDKVWNYFEEISRIPRCSKNEEEIGEYILSVAEKNGLEAEQDEVGNIVIKKPSTTDHNAPITVLQSHMDMVCEKDEDVDHDFTEDPIKLKKEGEWVTAEGTTLGADDGIGVAISLAIATSENLEHGPLEFLFTVDEETGLTGAFNLKKDFIEGKKLINLDSEEFGEFTIGCAGGGNTEIFLPIDTTEKDQNLIQIKVTGLKGGHSGVEIDKGRANSIKIIGRLLWNLKQKTDFTIKEIEGGQKHNAIPRTSKTIISTQKTEKQIQEIIKNEFRKIKEEYKEIDENMELKTQKIQQNKQTKTLTPESTEKTINLIRALPHGVIKMDPVIENLVRTSTNLAIIRKTNNQIKITMSTRSSLETELEATRNRIKSIAKNFKCEIEEEKPYPGWKPQKNTELLKTLKTTYKNTFKQEPKIKAIHAGLETGIIGKKYKNMEMVSIGPEIQNPHTPQEKVNTKSVQKFWKHLTKTLKQITKNTK